MRHRTPTSRQPRKTSREDGRRWNLLTTLQTISTQGTTSRAEIARLTGLTRATVSTLVNELLDDELVTELGVAERDAAGKPPTLLAVNGSGRQIVAVDLSQQPFRGALVGLDGAMHQRRRAADPATGDAAIRAAIDLVGDCLDDQHAPILGIGVGTPGMIGPDGSVRESAHLDWHDVALRSTLTDEFDLPVVVGNDAHVSALAELQAGATAGDRDDDLLLVAVGEGIGAGLVLGGALHTGNHLSSGEIGHVVVDPAGAQCRCGLRGCLETLAAVPAVARDGDTVDLASAATAATHLAATLAVVTSAIDVDRIIIASELTAVEGWLATLTDELAAHMHPARRAHIAVHASDLADPVLSGAAAAVMGDVLGVVLR